MDLFVKICGICSRSDLEQISAFQPDAVGFIQWSKSKRYVDPATVGDWETPEGMIADLKPSFPFSLDAAASRPNVCENFLSEDVRNAFTTSWGSGDPDNPSAPFLWPGFLRLI